jgi:hypothetical protein
MLVDISLAELASNLAILLRVSIILAKKASHKTLKAPEFGSIWFILMPLVRINEKINIKIFHTCCSVENFLI